MDNTNQAAVAPQPGYKAQWKEMRSSSSSGVKAYAIILIVSILSGAASGWWFASRNAYEVYVVDVKQIVQTKKDELIERYKKNPTDEIATEVDKELTDFLMRLDRGITRLGGEKRLVLLKDAVLSGAAADATETLKEAAGLSGRKKE